MSKKYGNVHIGTSGWHYKHWIGTFYPVDSSSSQFLSFYCTRLQTTEINNSFYRLPSAATMDSWRDTTPDNFIFTMKVSRYLTHLKKLKDPEKPLAAFLEKADILGSKLGPILVQLPPNWHCNCDRLRFFLDTLPGGYRYAFEFRDQSWFNDSIYQALEERKVALCVYHLQGFQSPKIITADFMYIRLHGPGKAYQGNYETQVLSGWAGAFSAWRRKGTEIFCYFDNDQNGYAAANALELRDMVDGG